MNICVKFFFFSCEKSLCEKDRLWNYNFIRMLTFNFVLRPFPQGEKVFIPRSMFCISENSWELKAQELIITPYKNCTITHPSWTIDALSRVTGWQRLREYCSIRYIYIYIKYSLQFLMNFRSYLTSWSSILSESIVNSYLSSLQIYATKLLYDTIFVIHALL